jgi:predicted dehydrogenase
VRAAVIGCGKIGSEFADDPRVRGVYTHAGAYSAVGRVQLAGVCDVDPVRAERCAQRWAVPRAFTDVHRLLADVSPEIVSVCTPDATHAHVLRTVLAAPSVRGVLAEKPLAGTAAEAAELVARAEQRGIVLAVNYVRRYAPGHRNVKDSLASGEIGDVLSVTGMYSGGLVHNGSHWLDLARWLIGEIVTVKAHGDTAATDGNPDVTLELAGGVTAFLRGCRDAAFSAFEADILGTKGRIRLVDSGHRIERYGIGDSPYYSGYHVLAAGGVDAGGIEDAMTGAVDDLLDCVATGRAPQCSGRDGVAALAAAEAAFRSFNTGRPERPG